MVERVVISFSLTESEKQAFVDYANERDWGLSELFRYMCLQGIPNYRNASNYDLRMEKKNVCA